MVSAWDEAHNRLLFPYGAKNRRYMAINYLQLAIPVLPRFLVNRLRLLLPRVLGNATSKNI